MSYRPQSSQDSKAPSRASPSSRFAKASGRRPLEFFGRAGELFFALHEPEPEIAQPLVAVLLQVPKQLVLFSLHMPGHHRFELRDQAVANNIAIIASAQFTQQCYHLIMISFGAADALRIKFAHGGIKDARFQRIVQLELET